MRSLFTVTVVAALGALAIAGCSKPAEAPTAPATAKPAAQAAAPVAATPPQPASTPAAAPAAAAPATTPAPAEPAVALPEGFTSKFHVHPEMTIKTVETVDAAQGKYAVTGELRASAKEVLDYYAKYFREHGWEEDAIMEQEGSSVVSFKKDGYLEFVDTHEGGIGVRISITTGPV